MSGPLDRAAGPSAGVPQTPRSRGAHFPFAFIHGFLSFLAHNRDKLGLITYADLDWQDDVDASASYPAERSRFHARSARLAAEGRAQVLLQHDVDARPHRTHAVVRAERALGVPSSIMLFNKRVDRRRLNRTGELGYTEYPIDDELLRGAQDEGFVIGYHFNAMERAGWDRERAWEVFVEDVADLRTRFDIDFVSAHGGVRSPEGLKNRDLPVEGMAGLGVRWVHNGHTPRFTKNYSDGGLNGTKLDPASRDLRDFVRQMEPGGRYRVLLHPQYYSTPTEPAPGLNGTAWYDHLLRGHADDEAFDSWAGVRLSW